MRHLCSAAALAAVLALPAPAQETPNVLLVIADDLGYGDVGCFGAPSIETPAIDRVAAEGAKLTSFYVHPSCSPTRAALLTGRYAQRVSIDAPLGFWSPRGLGPAEVTLAEELQNRGYRTGFFGKWHLGDSPDQLPTAQGFDDWFGTPWGLIGRPDVLFDSQAPPIVSQDPATWTRAFTDRTLAFIDSAVQQQRPFFAVLAHHLPHAPVTPSPGFVGQSADGRDYGDGVEEIDAGIDELLQRLEQLQIAEDTLVVFFSDNGPAAAYGPYQAGSAGPLRGWKGSTLEGGMRVPCVLRWPGGVPAGQVLDEPLFVADLMPTLLSIVDGAAPTPGKYDGRDVQRVVRQGLPMPAGEDTVAFVGPSGVVDGVRRGALKWRLGALYDLASDIGETTDIAALYPQEVAELEAARQALETDILASRRPAAASLRVRPTWRAPLGLPGAATLLDGDTWAELEMGAAGWTVHDLDPAADISLVTASSARPVGAPASALHLDAPSPDLRLLRTGGEFQGHGAGEGSVSLWWTTPPALDQALVLLDVGDDVSGLSLSIGDLGQLGDDAAPGRHDDLCVRVGGDGSVGNAALDVDLAECEGRLTLLTVTLSATGLVTVYQDGILLGQVDAGAPVDWGAAGLWALLGQEGPLGGVSALAPPAPTAAGGAGEVAALRVLDRELLRPEVEAEYGRFVTLPYCVSQTNSTGAVGRLELFGSFIPAEQRLWAHVSGLPAGTVGVFVAGTEQTRWPALSGYFCLGGSVLRLRLAVVPPGETQTVFPAVRAVGGPGFNAWLPEAGSAWNVQFVYRDGLLGRMTNAVAVRFAP